MDDKTIAANAWLTFSLAFPNPAKLCNLLRTAIPDANGLEDVLSEGLLAKDPRLSQLLDEQVKGEFRKYLDGAETKTRVERALQWENESAENHLITLASPHYPTLLKQTDYAPPVLYAKGNLGALDHPQLAVVGSRKASNSSLNFTLELCERLAGLGIGIVSGLARGVDAAAHTGALAGNGSTVAVAATDPLTVYPKQHKALAERISNNKGLLLTEYPIGTTTRPWYFPQRNRIISGMSLGVLVVEAALPSGTLTTATHAMNQGREVMAIPGSIYNQQARGCHALIKQGAALVESVQDIVEILGEPLQRLLDDLHPKSPVQGSLLENEKLALPTSTPQLPSMPETETWVLQTLSENSATIDEIMALAQKEARQITISSITTSIGWLEIKGFITSESGGRYARC